VPGWSRLITPEPVLARAAGLLISCSCDSR
jgi:hypothetical protein